MLSFSANEASLILDIVGVELILYFIAEILLRLPLGLLHSLPDFGFGLLHGFALPFFFEHFLHVDLWGVRFHFDTTMDDFSMRLLKLIDEGIAVCVDIGLVRVQLVGIKHLHCGFGSGHLLIFSPLVIVQSGASPIGHSLLHSLPFPHQSP